MNLNYSINKEYEPELLYKYETETTQNMQYEPETTPMSKV